MDEPGSGHDLAQAEEEYVSPQMLIAVIACVSLPVFVYLFVKKKFLLRLITRRSEIERVLGATALSRSDADLASMTAQVDRILLCSTHLKGVREVVHKPQQFDVTAVCNNIVQLKGISDSNAIDNLRQCLQRMNDVAAVVEETKTRRATKFSSDNPSHEKLLEELWDLLMPEVRREGGRHTDEWGTIGFQGRDPATDFRGMGILGLECLVWFARNMPQECRAVLSDTMKPDAQYFALAITGINITGWTTSLLDRRRLHHLLYRKKNCSMDYFFSVYCKIFILFNEFWKEENPPNVLSFGPISEKFLKEIEHGNFMD